MTAQPPLRSNPYVITPLGQNPQDEPPVVNEQTMYLNGLAFLVMGFGPGDEEDGEVWSDT